MKVPHTICHTNGQRAFVAEIASDTIPALRVAAAILWASRHDKILLWFCEFAEADLRLLNLYKTTIIGCRFTRCNFSEASFKNCEFEDCEFTECEFTEIEIVDSRFERCIFSQNSITHGFGEATLVDCDLNIREEIISPGLHDTLRPYRIPNDTFYGKTLK